MEMSVTTVTKHCPNCKKEVAEANFVMHEVHCRRNIVLCSKCDAPVPKVQLEEHIEENHALVNCDLCSRLVERSCLSGHKTELCSKRDKVCSYCSLSVKADELEDHESYCGTRTEQCVKCHSYIMHKDLIIHDESGCNLPEQTELTSKPDFFDHYQPDSLNDFSLCLSDLQIENEDKDDYRRLNQKYMNSCAYPYFDLDSHQKNLNSNGDSSLDRRSMAFERHKDDRWHNEQLEDKKYFDAYLKYNAQQKSNGINEVNEMRDPYLDSDEDITFLPCEFCDESFPVDVIIQHQAICSNHFENPKSNLVQDYGANFFEKKDKIDSVKSSLAESLAREPTLLPCEFCSEPYRNDELMSHQVSCKIGHFLNNDGYAVEDVKRPPSLPSGLNKTGANKSSAGSGSPLRCSTSIPTGLSHLENSSAMAAVKPRLGASENHPRNTVGIRKPISKQLPPGAKTANISNTKLTSHQLKESSDALQFRRMKMNDLSKSPGEVTTTNLSRAGFGSSKQNSAMNQQSSRQIGRDNFQLKSTRVAAGNQPEYQRKKEQEMEARKPRTMTTASNNQRKDSRNSQDQHGHH